MKPGDGPRMSPGDHVSSDHSLGGTRFSREDDPTNDDVWSGGMMVV